jgi:hypothetical protein
MKYYDVKNTFIKIERMMAMLYEPAEKTDLGNIAILIMHSDGDYLNFVPGPELAKRGYITLCANVVGASKPLDEKLLDVKAAVEYLKAMPGIQKVIILGHSGGATLMSCYQAVAENGNSFYQDGTRIVDMENVGVLPKADGFLRIDSNWGNGAMTLLSIDPAVEDERGVRMRDPELDIFNPQNGYDPEGSHYSEAFIRKLMSAQKERGKRLIHAALGRLQAIRSGEGFFSDDEPLIIPEGDQIAPNNRLFPEDISLVSHTKGKWPLIHGDGSISEEIVHSVRRPLGEKSWADKYHGGALVTSVRTFLSSQAVYAGEGYYIDESGIYGIDYDSSYCCTPGNAEHIHVPLLIMGMTAGYEFMAAEEIYRHAASEDKTMAFVSGLNHPLKVAKNCEKYPGEFGDPVLPMFDYISEWIQKRYLD